MRPVPVTASLAENHGLLDTDLRVLLTDRYNPCCTYRMPAEGLAWIPARTLMTDGEVVRLEAVGRLAGCSAGPVHRWWAPAAAESRGRRRRGRRTRAPLGDLADHQGHRLRDAGEGVAAAGLDRINVSLDTLRDDRFNALSRRDRLAYVLGGVAAAHATDLRPVKFNAVLMRGVNEGEAQEVLAFAVEHGPISSASSSR